VDWGVHPDALRHTMARILAWSVSGEAHDGPVL
jgi:hypothetical protein